MSEKTGDAATIERLEAELAAEKAKGEVLVGEVVALEDELTNRTLAEFADVVSDATKDFWREQLVVNRTSALAVLGELSTAKRAAGGGAPAVPASVPRPLHNRSTARPMVPGAVVPGGGTGGVPAIPPGKIRNRAHEICAQDKVPFVEAFRRAEREIAG